MYRWKCLVRAAALVIGLAVLFPRSGGAQEHGVSQDAARLRELVRGITVTPRVLLIGAHPDDDDPDLIAWLAHGHEVETGFLSITRGENGQNYLSGDVGSFLGAVRTEESLAARRIDGGHQFFTRAYDFGVARDTTDVFKHWARDSVLADIIAVIRAFRPQVVVLASSDSNPADDGQHAATVVLAREAFAAAADTVRFPAATYGSPWRPRALYRHGGPLRIDTREFDPVLGKTYADLAAESREQRRSQGLLPQALTPSQIVRLERVIAPEAAAAFASASDSTSFSIFDGIDTSFARLAPEPAGPRADAVRALAAYADSANRALDLARPAGVVRYLAQAARLANELRREIPSCNHPAAVILAPETNPHLCDAVTLDRDASIDIIQHRVTEALLIAAGVQVHPVADRELFAATDTVPITIALSNYGEQPVRVGDLVVDGALQPLSHDVNVPPDSTAYTGAIVTDLPDGGPWWLGSLKDNLFAAPQVATDGLMRAATIATPFTVPSAGLPEDLRRVSDITLTVTIDSVSVTTSVGPITFHYANPLIGVQDRAVSGVPAMTLSFPRSLEWVVAKKRVDRIERLSLESFSDHPQTLSLQLVTPAGLHVVTPPTSVTLAPHEQRELFLRVTGKMSATDSTRQAFGAVGKRPGTVFMEGFQAVEYPHIPALRVFSASGFWLQSVDMSVPPHLIVAYVPGPGDDIVRPLRDIGIEVVSLTPDDLPSADLSQFTTLVIGPRAFDAYPALMAQRGRVTDFAEQGGTVVMLQQESPDRAAPYPLGLRVPRERVTAPGAPVTILDPNARLLDWPNRLGPADWSGWVVERAAFMPTTIDPHYTTYIETHDAKQPSNRNGLLSARVGKGLFVYTSLSLEHEIAGGVGGGLRLLVNMMSAGLTPQAAEPRP